MKRLIVLCDGTGQSSHRGDKGGFPTNVKTFGDCLTQTIQEKKGPPRTQEVSQIIYYQSGVGTSDALAVSDWLSGTTDPPPYARELLTQVLVLRGSRAWY